MGSQPNGHHPLVSSTEEESSSEPPVVAPAETPDASKTPEEPELKESTSKEGEDTNKHSQLYCSSADSQSKSDGESQDKQADFQPSTETSESSDAEAQPKHTKALLVAQVDCVNGDESMDSLDSQSLKKSSEAGERSPESSAEGSAKPQQEEHKNKDQSKPTQELTLQDRRAETNVLEGQDKEEESKGSKCQRNLSEQLKESADRTEEEPQEVPAHPPVLVDHQRLSVLLDVVVKKSDGYSVEQLERLYSILSQSIYQHRRKYDKSQLLEEMEERIHRFDTFL
ncbi:hypothetical protein LDENG_00184220 [Lucifuga dentata]|nr:hypothetical protein LDENG_00184220 [Lucifuga dentata]